MSDITEEGGVSTGYAATTGARGTAEQTIVHAETRVADITDGIVDGLIERGLVRPADRQHAHDLTTAALAGRVVVDLPEPDGRTYGGPVRWDASARRIVAKVDTQGRPFVRLDKQIWLTGEAESVGLALVAAAREAQRLAAQEVPAVEPRRWPVGSREPKEKGLRVKSEINGVIFRYEYGRWLAEESSGGDGHRYSWHSMNGEDAGGGGMELAQVAGGGVPHE